MRLKVLEFLRGGHPRLTVLANSMTFEGCPARGSTVALTGAVMMHRALKRAWLEPLLSALVVAASCSLPAPSALASPPPRDAALASTELPAKLTLDDALRIFRERGIDLFLADAAIAGAEADRQSAGAVQNPSLNAGYGRVLNYPATCAGCSANEWTVGLSDQSALEDVLSGKRGLRMKAARASLAVAKHGRTIVLREVAFQIKQAYVEIAAAQAALDFTKEVQTNAAKVLELNQLRYPRVIDEGALSRVMTTKLESDQAVDMALQTLRMAQVELAALLGVRSHMTNFEVDRDFLRYVALPKLDRLSIEDLTRLAFEHRPDLRVTDLQRERAEAAVDLARRQRVPDIALSAQYSQIGTGGEALQPPTVLFGVTTGLPVFYQQQGEIRRAETEVTMHALDRQKLMARIVADVESAHAAFEGSRRRLERMEGGLLESSRKARDITKLQFEAGAAALMDYLDARRTYIATNMEYFQNLTSYWTAIFQMEQAVGMDLR